MSCSPNSPMRDVNVECHLFASAATLTFVVGLSSAMRLVLQQTNSPSFWFKYILVPPNQYDLV